jgi:cytochrome c5
MRIPTAVLCLAAASLLSAACAKQEAPPPAAPAAPSAPAAAPAAPAADGKALFESKCGACHGLDRSTAQKHTKEEWLAIVKKMQARSPAISEGDGAAIADYLATSHGK